MATRGKKVEIYYTSQGTREGVDSSALLFDGKNLEIITHGKTFKGTDHTYDVFGASGSGASSGLVPAPSTTAGSSKYLREDGTWADLNLVNPYVGPTTTLDASVGYINSTPGVGQTNKFFRSDGSWVTLSKSTVGLGNVDNTADASKNVASAGKATSISGGAQGSLPYQSAADTTAFLAGGSDGQILTYDGTNKKPYWKNDARGTVTKVSTGVGLTGGDITSTGTVKAKLKSETAATADSAAMGNTENRQYAVGVDKSGYLSVNIPWTDHTYTVNNNTFRLKSKIGDSTTTLSDFTANQGSDDDFTLIQGSNITFTNDATNRTLTIAGTPNTWRPVGTGASDAAAGNHTHGISIAADSGTNQLSLAANTKYKLTAGGQSYIFTTPADNNTWKAATTSQEGYAPKLATGGGTIATQSTEYVLTFKSGTDSAPVWRLLPANAYKNDNTDTNVLQQDDNGNASRPVLMKYGTGTGDVTNRVLTCDGVTINPSNNSLSVGGDLSVSGKASFSNNVTLSAGGLDIQTATLGSDLTYGGGAHHSSYHNIICRGNTSTGVSGIAFTSSKGTTSINVPSDCAFIQFHPYNPTLAGIGSNPSLGTSGESNKLVIGVNNDSDDMIYLQTPGGDGLKHVVGTSVYDIITSRNISTQSVKYATSAGGVAWGNVSDKPATATRWPSWSEVTSKPSTFTPASHSHDYLPLSGGTLTGNISFSNSGTGFRGINYGTMGDNDQWRIGGAATGSNAGYMEIATADDGIEPIYVRQYTGVFSSLTRTATLLDGSGNTSFPGTVSASSFSGSVSWGNVTSKPGATGGSTTPVYWNGSGFTNCTAYGSASVNYANSAGSADKVDGYHADSFLRHEGWWNSGSGQNVDDAHGMVFAYSSHNRPGSWGIVATFEETRNSSYRLQLAGDGWSNELYFRNRSADRNGWYDGWKTIIHSSNIGSQSVNYANSAGSVSWSNVSGKPFNWSGQSGQPTWLWGSNDGSNYYVWNPSNFSVNYANSAGNADTVDSQHFSYSNSSNSPTYLWATNSNGSSFLAARGSISVNYANSAGSANSVAWGNVSSKPITVTYGTMSKGTGSSWAYLAYVSMSVANAQNVIAFGFFHSNNYQMDEGYTRTVGNGLTKAMAPSYVTSINYGGISVTNAWVVGTSTWNPGTTYYRVISIA